MVGQVFGLRVIIIWAFNQRPHSVIQGESWNYCTHSDGLQYCSEPSASGLTVENSIFGPGFGQLFILGMDGRDSTMHDFTLRNTLLVGYPGNALGGQNIYTYSPSASGPPTGYVFDKVTSFKEVGQNWWNFVIRGSSHEMRNSIFMGGRSLYMAEEPLIVNTYRWQVIDGGSNFPEMDPMFVDSVFPGLGDDFADFDFTIQNPAMVGVGSTITKVSDLIGKDP